MDALYICTGVVEAEQIVNYEFMKRLQQERHTSQRCAVQSFTLLVTYCLFNDLDDELCVFWTELKLRSFQICEETINSLLQLLARDLSSAPDRFAVSKDDRPVLAVNLFQWMRVLQQVRLVSLRQERYCRTSS